MAKVFIDGQEGTTGLKIHARLAARGDIALLEIDPQRRKDPQARAEMIRAADVAILCLPDEAARESAALAEGAGTVVIDTSTAHRTQAGWAYGFPELSGEHRRAVEGAKHIAVPGCHATGYIAAVYPLVAMGLLPAQARLTCHSITGYSGGGKRMIAAYEAPDRPAGYDSPRQYGLGLAHKHLPEMRHVTGMAHAPIFNPIVCDFYAGMAVSVPLALSALTRPMTLAALRQALADYYAGQGSHFVTVHEAPPDGFLPANLLTDTNELHVYACGNNEVVTLVSILDNLGKGASGAAMQCMNIALGMDEKTGF